MVSPAVSSRITKCAWCRTPICLFGSDTLWTRLDCGYPDQPLECGRSPHWPQAHLPIGRDGWIPSPKYRRVRWW